MRKEHWLSNRDLMGETMFIVTFDLPFEATKVYIVQLIDQLKLAEIVLNGEEEIINKINRDIGESFNLQFSFFIDEGFKGVFFFSSSNWQHSIIIITYSKDNPKCNKINETIIRSIAFLYQGIYFESNYASWQNQEFIVCYNHKGGLKYTKDINKTKMVDISDRPGRRGQYPINIPDRFTGASKFWFGPDFYALQPKEAFLAFQDCIEVKDLGEKGVSVYLYPIYEGDEPLSQQRQWSLRNFLKVDEPMPYVETPEYIPKDKIEQFIDTEPSVLTAIHPGRHIVCVKTDALATLVKDVFTEDVKIFRTNGIQAAEFVWKVSNGMAIQVNSSWCLLVLRNERLDLTKDSERAFYADLLSEYEEAYVFYVHEGHAVYGHLKKGIYQRLVYFMGHELKYESGPISKEEQELMETYDRKLSKKNPFRVLLEESNGKAWYLDDGFMEGLCAAKCIDLRNPEQYGILDLAYITSYQPLIEPPTKPWWKFW